jgi:two-component system, cell cycle sensor histidine kinase and response regulator CckA
MSTALFPRIEREDLKKSAQSTKKMEAYGPETILVAEDDDSMRILASRSLRDRGYKVLEAANGKEAVRLAKEYEEEIHLILADAVMPGMGGRNAVEHIRTFRSGIKSLYTSGYSNTSIIELGILDKDTAFLQKPYDVAALTQKVRAVLDADN